MILWLLNFVCFFIEAVYIYGGTAYYTLQYLDARNNKNSPLGESKKLPEHKEKIAILWAILAISHFLP